MAPNRPGSDISLFPCEDRVFCGYLEDPFKQKDIEDIFVLPQKSGGQEANQLGEDLQRVITTMIG